MHTDNFSSIEWHPVGGTKAWGKNDVPYTSDASSSLQTLNIWLPAQEDKPPASVASRPGPWIVYIHGGAWRDPFVQADTFDATALTLLKNGPAVGGIASINYRLSPSSKFPVEPGTAGRDSKHPDHIADVLAGLTYLQSLGAARDYVLAGHSCGATLAFQVIMDPSRFGLKLPVFPRKPRVVVGLNGLYDLTAFLQQPDESHRMLAPAYEEFTRDAFGDDEAVWVAACPTAVKDWAAEWAEGVRVVLVQSPVDTLVPYSQLEHMRANLVASRAQGLLVDEMSAGGDHNSLWEEGGRLAEILGQVVSEWTA